MASADKVRKVFCDKILCFSQDMRVVLSGDKEATQVLSALDAMVGMSPDLVIQVFRTHIAVPYEKKIMERDESFLRNELDKHLGEKTLSLSGSSGNPLDNLHHKIHDRWGSLEESQKAMIWDYFKLLVILSKRV